MSPTVFRHGRYRFFFFSREESRMHVHVAALEGEAKFWLEPEVELAQNFRLSLSQIGELTRLVEGHRHEFEAAWARHFLR